MVSPDGLDRIFFGFSVAFDFLGNCVDLSIIKSVWRTAFLMLLFCGGNIHHIAQ